MKLPDVYLEMIDSKRAEPLGVVIVPYTALTCPTFLECPIALDCAAAYQRRIFIGEARAHTGAKVNGLGEILGRNYGIDVKPISDEPGDENDIDFNIRDFRDLRKFSGESFSIAVLRSRVRLNGEDALRMTSKAYAGQVVRDNSDLLLGSLDSAIKIFRKSGVKLNPKKTYTLHAGMDEEHVRTLANITHPGQKWHVLGKK